MTFALIFGVKPTLTRVATGDLQLIWAGSAVCGLAAHNVCRVTDNLGQSATLFANNGVSKQGPRRLREFFWDARDEGV
jgi:hypothetical protein